MHRTTPWWVIWAGSALVLTAGLAPARDVGQPAEVQAAKARSWDPVPAGGFSDSVHHAVMDQPKGNLAYDRYAPDQIVHIAENLLAWQNPDGGWPKNKDWLRVWSPEELALLPGNTGQPGKDSSTFDNRSTWAQIDYLARVHQQTRLARYAEASGRGIHYTLSRQHRNGGWRGADVDAITFNDDVMAGILGVLKRVAEGGPAFAFVDEPLRRQVRTAYQAGLDCVIQCQIRVGDRLTAWCQQHDHDSLKPTWARSFEPPSIVTAESVGVVNLLMSIDSPSPNVIASVQAAVTWLRRVQIEGLRVDRIDAEPVEYRWHWTDFDRVEVPDPQAPPIWTRLYDLETEEPIFCTRSREITRRYTDLSRERRTGYGWYGYWPAELLERDYPAWQRKWGLSPVPAEEAPAP